MPALSFFRYASSDYLSRLARTDESRYTSEMGISAINFAKRFSRVYFGVNKATAKTLQCPYGANGLFLPGWWEETYKVGIEAKGTGFLVSQFN